MNILMMTKMYVNKLFYVALRGQWTLFCTVSKESVEQPVLNKCFEPRTVAHAEYFDDTAK